MGRYHAFKRRKGQVSVAQDNCVRLMTYHGIGEPGMRYTVTCDETGVIVLTPVDFEAAWISLVPDEHLDESISAEAQEVVVDVAHVRGVASFSPRANGS